jgi:hypothetical protein
MDADRIRATVRERLRTGVLPSDLPPAEPVGGQPASPVPAIRTEQGTGRALRRVRGADRRGGAAGGV